MSEPTYTLAEAQRVLALTECRDFGHDWDFEPRRMMDEAPPGIACARCGWRGEITMGDKP